ncbi:ribosome small subunit-dependent GTPase A [Lentibacter sp. XHP0401]|jgi:ribosome biogenesis GTPase / thiamine phosphate phosphatase|uniref:ribosome small subunit-dependent GTPase A n=1 Tax=Lentibacter sp. XHP0401 TaxID=2984334 RepID=UPI0021E73AA2|nr:ribosome small subunit-dependent GTPase A [Lentibacter sp. XHP0401]MCV2892692.1 ribosome small subunit-dependent GTPase A [Lentibacter sp. XHP0401]
MTRETTEGLPQKNIPLSLLQKLGWQPFFAEQTNVEAMAATPPVRVTEVHRSGHHVVGEGIDEIIPPRPDATVGDWLLLNEAEPAESVVLERKNLIKRRAPGPERQVQLIGANLDTTFIVTSCNDDFNIARLERYVALAFEDAAAPVILLTKADMSDDVESYLSQARSISKDVPVLVIDGRGEEPRDKLAGWCKPGKTVAFIGSSGVGKSTLTNALAGGQDIRTQGIREGDAKGRHTTTSRQLHMLASGCNVLDTPGMREVQLTDAASGLGDLFADLQELSTQCRFRDCKHESEPGCAVKAAHEAGNIDEPRLMRWKKLVAEDAFNSESLSPRKAMDRTFGRVTKQGKKRGKR